MEILFADPRLREAILQDRGFPGLLAPIKARARRTVRMLEAMPDMLTLRNWKSARFGPCRVRKGVHQIGLQGRHHFLVRVDETLAPPAITIIGIDQEPQQAAGELAHENA